MTFQVVTQYGLFDPQSTYAADHNYAKTLSSHLENNGEDNKACDGAVEGQYLSTLGDTKIPSSAILVCSEVMVSLRVMN